jgi:hypothetical protein
MKNSPNYNSELSALLLYRTGYIGKGVICIGPDQAYCPHYQNQNYGQHYRIFGDILTFLFRPNPADKLGHALPPICNLNSL